MVKVLLHLNVFVPLRPDSSSASPSVVPYVQGSGPLTTCGPSWSGDGVAMADEPAASGVPPLAGVALHAGVPPPANDDPAPVGVTPLVAGVALPTGCVG
jgi:hypothetical protein